MLLSGWMLIEERILNHVDDEEMIGAFYTPHGILFLFKKVQIYTNIFVEQISQTV